MEALWKSFTSMEERMAKLEEENESLSIDILGLKKENIFLKKEIRQLKNEQPVETRSVPQTQAESPGSDSARTRTLMDIQGEVTSLKAIVGKVESSHTATSKEIAALEHRLGDLEKESSRHQKLAGHRTRVLLGHTRPLLTGRDRQLDEFYHHYFGSMVDEREGWVIPPVAGHYLVTTHMLQKGDGGIRLKVKGEGHIDAPCGETGGDGDEATSFHLLQLDQGQKIWLEATRVKGDVCLVEWCDINVWLMQ